MEKTTSNQNKNKPTKGKDPKVTSAELVIEEVLSSEAVLFHDQYDISYIARYGHGGDILRLDSKKFADLIAHYHWTQRQKPLPPNADKQVVQVLTAKARFDGPLHHLEVRLARKDDELWYDLADGQAVRITNAGWEVIKNPPILFRRIQQKPQSIPEPGQVVEHLLNYVNLDDEEEKLLFLIYVIAAFITGFPHPLLILHGPQGAGKTTPMRVIKELVDPSIVQGMPLPDKVPEFVQLADHHAFLFFDNLSNLPTKMSDALARAATGDSFSKRQLYTDSDDVVYRIQKTISINGINQVVIKPDLLDRAILIKLERIAPEHRLPEAEFWAAFHHDKPQILGAIFDVLAKALAIYPTIELTEIPRMADFTHWGCAIAEAAGYGQQAFINAYKNNIGKQNEEAIEASPVAKAMILFMKDKDIWQGSPAELLRALNSDPATLGLSSSQLWPKAEEWLTRRLNDVQVNLNAIGIRIEHYRTPEGRKMVITNDNYGTNESEPEEPAPQDPQQGLSLDDSMSGKTANS